MTKTEALLSGLESRSLTRNRLYHMEARKTRAPSGRYKGFLRDTS